MLKDFRQGIKNYIRPFEVKGNDRRKSLKTYISHEIDVTYSQYRAFWYFFFIVYLFAKILDLAQGKVPSFFNEQDVRMFLLASELSLILFLNPMIIRLKRRSTELKKIEENMHFKKLIG